MLKIAKKKKMRTIALTILLTLSSLICLANTYHPANTLQQKDGLSSNNVKCIFKDSMGFMWFGTDNGIDIYDAATISSVRKTGIGINSITEASGHIYIGSEKGLYEYDRATNDLIDFSAKTEFGVEIVSPITHLLSTGNTLVICTEGQGIFLYHHNTGKFIQCSISIPFVTDATLSKDGTLYISERESGIHSISMQGEHLGLIYSEKGISDIHSSDCGLFFVSGNQKNIFNILENEKTKNQKLPYTINHIYDTDPREIILSTNKGVVKIDKETLKSHNLYITSHGEDITFDTFNDILKDNEGTLWIASTSNGVVTLPQKSMSLTRHSKGEILFETPSENKTSANFSDSEGKLIEDKADSEISTISCSDKDGNIYKAVGNESIYKISPLGKTEVYYLLNNVSEIFCDHQNQIWAGTSVKGLWYLSGKEFIQLPISSTYGPASIVYSIEQDNEGFLWVCSDIGIVKIDPTNKAQMTIIATDEAQSSDKFLPRVSRKSPSGTLYFGRENSALSFNPSDIFVNRWAPPTVLKSMTFTNGSTPITCLYNNESIKLPHNSNSFTIDFAVLSYQDPQSNSYSYCLSSVDTPDIWSKDNKAVYRNLKPGKYTFTVKGRNNDGVESASAACINIVITPPWYGSILAYLIYTLIIVGAAIYAYHVWKRRIDNKYIGILNKGRETIEKEAYYQKMNFFLGMVHEFRTPMTIMKLSLDSLMKEDKPDKEALASIQENLEYMQDTVTGIMNFHKKKSDGIRLVLSKTDLTRICQSLVKKFRETAKIKGLKLDLTIPDEAIYVMADEPFLAKIIMNMLSNAFKYAKTTVSLTLACDQENITVRVRDDGPGVKEAEKEKIFDMFYKAAGDKIAEASGLGVGLAYSRKLAQHHDGTLILEDSLGEGASFLLTIPAIKESLEEVGLSSGQAESSEQTDESSAEKLRIVVADDNLQLIAKLEKELSQWYNVKTAHNGAEALKIIEKEEIDIIISDVMMPVMNGVELCDTIKNKQELSHIPFILLTALNNVDDKAEGLKSGADAYIEKPFSVIQLHYQIENLMKLRNSFQKTVKDAAGNPNAQEPQLNTRDAEFVSAINAAIDGQIRAEDFSIDALADTMCMSKTNFYRKFHAITGTSPNEYLKNYRLNRAASMIKDGARINEAAESVGFFSSSYFAKCFKAKFGVLPKDYKK